jgi:6-phosphofructokinase 1
MTVLRDGNYATVPADTCVTGRKRVDVDAFYDASAYRPRIAQVSGKPMFFY